MGLMLHCGASEVKESDLGSIPVTDRHHTCVGK